MSNILDKQIVLSLNKSWLPIGMRSVRQAIVSLCPQHDSDETCLALDFEIIKDDNGNDMLTYANPLTWDEWILLPVRPQDLSINSARREIRVPTVIVTASFNKVPLSKPKVSARSIYERDGGIDQYTGLHVPRGSMTLDHVIPKSRGGKDTFENLVTCAEKVNMAKADRTPEEAGLKLLKKPKSPPEMPIIIRKSDARHESWIPFLSV